MAHTNSICTNRKPLSAKKTTCLPQKCYTYEPVSQNTTLVAPFRTKGNPSMGYPGVCSFQPWCTTFKSTIRSVFLWLKTCHCSRSYPAICPFKSSLLHICWCTPPPPSQCALWFFSGKFIHDGLLVFTGAEPLVSAPQQPLPPLCRTHLYVFVCIAVRFAVPRQRPPAGNMQHPMNVKSSKPLRSDCTIHPSLSLVIPRNSGRRSDTY